MGFLSDSNMAATKAHHATTSCGSQRAHKSQQMKTGEILLFLCLVLLTNPARAQKYDVIDLGTGQSSGSYAQSINNKGQVVGYSYKSDGAHAFLYDTGELIDLGNLGGTNTYALSLNDKGQAAGVLETISGAEAFILRNGSFATLGNLGALNSYAYGINNNGDIVGYLDTLTGARAFLYQGGTNIDIGTLGGTNSFGYGVNSLLQVAGASLTSDNGLLHAFFWQTNAIRDLNEGLASPVNWQLREARAINDLGQIVGSGILNGHEHGFLYQSGVVSDLGILNGGTNSYALALNNHQDIVGASSTAANRLHASLWRNGEIVDLNSMLPNNSRWELREATGINDLGQIVGSGILAGKDHAFLLTPISPATSGAGATGGKKPGIRPLVDSFSVMITNPPNGSSFTFPTNIPIFADPSDSFGLVTQVQFFTGAALLGTSTSTPWTAVWTNVPVGAYSVNAVALDDGGLSATSAAINISVTLPLPGSLQLWLRADAGTITGIGNKVASWQDQSGNGNNATQSNSSNQPILETNVLNGYPVVHFDANSRFLNLPNFMSSATQGEAFVVLRAAQDTSSSGS